MTCDSCKHYEARRKECHRYPPSPFLLKDESNLPQVVSVYPPVEPQQTCGEHTVNIDAH